MANQERIEEFVSEAGFTQIDKLIKALTGANEHIVQCILSAEKLNAVLAKSGAFKDLEGTLKKVEIANERLRKVTAEATLAEERLAAARVKAADMAVKSAERTAAAQQKAIDKENANIVAMSKKGKAIISNSQLEIDAYNNTVNGSKKVNTTINDQNKAYAAASNEATGYVSATKKVTTETLKVKSAAIEAQKSINSLKIQLQSYKNIAENATDPKVISSFNLKAQETEATISRLSNVGKKGFDEFGNSLNKTTNYAGKAWGAIRTIANVLPGVGIAGLIAFAAEPIIEYVKQLDIFKKSASDLAKISALGSSEYKEAISDVARLKSAVGEFDQGVITSTELVKVYNDGIGKTAGALTTAAEVEDFYNSKASAYVQAMFLRSQANAALQLSTDKVTEAQIRATKGTTSGDKLLATLKNIGTSLTSGGFGNFANLFGDATDFQNKAVEKLKNESQSYLSLFEKLIVESDKFNKANGLNLNGAGDKPKPNTDDFYLQKQRLEILRESYKQISDDEKQSLDKRIGALQSYDETVRALIKLEAKNAIEQAGVSEKRKLAIKEKANYDLLNADKDFASKSSKIFEDQLTKEQKERLRVNQAELTAINNDEALKLDMLNKAFINQTISEQQHGELKLEIQKEYFSKYINAEIRQVEALLALSSLSVDERASYEEKLSKLKLKASEEAAKGIIDSGKLITKSEEENAKKREETEKQLSEKKKQLQQEVFDLGVAIVNSSFENEKNKVQKDIDLLDKQKERDIENVNNSVATEEEKADKIANIEAKSLANKEVLEQKQREIDQRKARFQKAIAAAEVAVNTAKDIAKISSGAAALSIIPIVGPALAAAALSQIPFVIGIGAAQIAAILATPIPAYFTGTSSSKGGKALTDELGAELYIPPSGKPFIGNDKPNIKNLQAGTRIIPHHELVNMIAKPELSPVVSGQQLDITALIAEQRSSTKELKKALSKQKPSKGPTVQFYGMGDYMTRNFN